MRLGHVLSLSMVLHLDSSGETHLLKEEEEEEKQNRILKLLQPESGMRVQELYGIGSGCSRTRSAPASFHSPIQSQVSAGVLGGWRGCSICVGNHDLIHDSW